MSELPPTDVSSIARLIWISTAGAATAAIIGTAVVHAIHARVIARSAMKSVILTMTVLAHASVYIVSINRRLARMFVTIPACCTASSRYLRSASPGSR